MKKISKKKHLEIAIESIPKHPKPKVELEQYSTPSIIAADLLWNSYNLGDIVNKNIVDLGCGTGIFAISAMLLGAKNAIGVDVDPDSIAIARKISNDFNILDIEFRTCNISNFSYDLNVDVVIQNPPFGSQERSKKGEDLKFINKALELCPKVIYSFHMASTEEFLLDYYEKAGLAITHIFRYKFPIPKIYKFHNKESKYVDVIVLRAENVK